MKASRHNGRSGKHGVYDVKHNDRDFDVEHSEHIDSERTKQNVYWDCYQGYSFAGSSQERQFNFTEIERAYYYEHYSDFVDAQNERNEQARHPERNRTIDDVLKNNKTCPEESVIQLGNIDHAVTPDVLAKVSAEFFDEFNKRYGSHHEGSNVRKMEAKGIRTEKGSLNRLIKEINQGILLLKEKVKDIMDVISELSEEMHRNEKSTKSDLSQCIQKYFADRNEMAESYSYGKNKARKTNLKKMAELLVYLEEHHISTIEELNEHVKGKKAELGILGQVNRRKKADIAGFKENLRYLNWYEEGIPIIGKIEKRKFNKAKERIKAENGDTLRRYHIAKRILTERELLGKMDKTTLQQKISSLETEAKENYAQYKSLARDIKQLQDICMFSKKTKEQKRQRTKEENSL